MMFIRDEVMVAYVDGELSARDCRMLEQLLDIDKAARRHMLSLRMATLYVKEAYEDIDFARAPASARMKPPVTRNARMPKHTAVAHTRRKTRSK